MAICPKCQLPNPAAVEACIWCGGHRFADSAVPEPVLALAVAGGDEPTSVPPSHVAILTTPGPIVESIDSRLPFPTPTSHVGPQSTVATPSPGETIGTKIQPKLYVLRGQKIGQEFPLYEGRNVIGRFADRPVDIDLVVQEAEGQIWSSRQHAAITYDKNMVLVEDLNSLNGTWVNGARLQAGQKRPLQANDVIQIGTVQLKLLIG